MKKLVTLVLAFTLILSLAACGGDTESSVENTSSEQSTEEISSTEEINLTDAELAKAVVENAIKATAELNYEEIEKYYDEPIITKDIIDYLPEDFANSMKLYIAVLRAEEIGIIENADGTITAVFDVTVPDFYALVNALSAKMMEKMEGMAESEMTQQEISDLQKYSYTLLDEVLVSEDCPTLTSSIAIGLEKVDGEWLITKYDALYDELLSDLEMVSAYVIPY